MLRQIRYDAETDRMTLGGEELYCGTSLKVLAPTGAGVELVKTRLEINWQDKPYLVGLNDVDVAGSWAELDE